MKKMGNVIRLGVSGDRASFSEEAGLLYANNNQLNINIHYLIDAEGVLSALANNKIDLGLFPVVNTSGGLVHMAFDAMGKYCFEVVDEVWMQINHCLLGRSGSAVADIKHIVSHSQPFKQCKKFLAQKSGITCIEYQDTALAAKHLAEHKLPESSAVIAPEAAAKLYGLEVLEKNIQDANPNLTAFIIVKNRGSDERA